MLTSGERATVARFILASKVDREKILATTVADPQSSGPLIQALRWASEL
jgi:hypothetical protein